MMNFEKTYVHESVFYIDDFLTKEELQWFDIQINDPKDWYITMRSRYKNILNKFLNTVPEYDEAGNIMLPNQDSKIIDLPIFTDPVDGIWARVKSILPGYYSPHATLQSFKYMTDEEIKANLKSQYNFEDIDYAMEDHADPTDGLISSMSLYLNDDFTGGELEFTTIPVVIKPKAGRLVVISTDAMLKHKVNKITSGNSRHTFYGNSWEVVNNMIPEIPMSTSENC